MGLENNAGVTPPFFQCILDADVLGSEVAEDAVPEWVDAAAKRFAAVFKKVTPSCRAIEIQIFRSGRIRGEGAEAALPPRDFWCVQMFLRPKPLLQTVPNVLPIVRNGAGDVGTR